jgi:D-alanyl-D-alanine carboxypeptidase (penicillin-binding protein 5/6)
MKKIILTLLAVLAFSCIIMHAASPTGIAAAEASSFTANSDGRFDFKSPAYFVVDYDTGTVLAEKDADKRRPIASMVKIMTLLITFDEIEAGKLSFDEELVISETAAGMGGSQMFLDARTRYKVTDLIKGVVVSSANDAAAALGERIAGSIDAFVARMNAYAIKLGMKDTLFANVTGLPGGEQYSTARDVTTMTRRLLTHGEYYSYSKIWIENYTHPSGRETEMVNTNKLIRFYEPCDGGKTGFTNDAMFCLSATAKNENMRVVATILGSPDSKTRFKEITDLFKFSFANFENRVLVKANETIEGTLKVKKAKDVDYKLYCDKEVKYFCRKGDVSSVKLVVKLEENLAAPVYKSTPIGKVSVVTADGKVIAESNIYSDKDIPKLTYKDALERALRNWFLK